MAYCGARFVGNPHVLQLNFKVQKQMMIFAHLRNSTYKCVAIGLELERTLQVRNLLSHTSAHDDDFECFSIICISLCLLFSTGVDLWCNKLLYNACRVQGVSMCGKSLMFSPHFHFARGFIVCTRDKRKGIHTETCMIIM